MSSTLTPVHISYPQSVSPLIDMHRRHGDCRDCLFLCVFVCICVVTVSPTWHHSSERVTLLSVIVQRRRGAVWVMRPQRAARRSEVTPPVAYDEHVCLRQQHFIQTWPSVDQLRCLGFVASDLFSYSRVFIFSSDTRKHFGSSTENSVHSMSVGRPVWAEYQL